MIFNFAIDEVKLCLVRRNFEVEAESVEEAQQEAMVTFDQLSGPEGLKQVDIALGSVEVFLDTEGRTDGYKELIYRAENGGQVLKDNSPKLPKYVITDGGTILWPNKAGTYSIYGTKDGPSKTSTIGWNLEAAKAAGFELVY